MHSAVSFGHGWRSPSVQHESQIGNDRHFESVDNISDINIAGFERSMLAPYKRQRLSSQESSKASKGSAPYADGHPAVRCHTFVLAHGVTLSDMLYMDSKVLMPQSVLLSPPQIPVIPLQAACLHVLLDSRF